jgi:hypothetical protein
MSFLAELKRPKADEAAAAARPGVEGDGEERGRVAVHDLAAAPRPDSTSPE